jgi:DNA-binding winged helix-turn-helix (wHTH) protein
MSSSSVYLFGPFRLHVASRLLLNGNQPVGLGSRAFDLLVALLEHAGQVVSPSALIKIGRAHV